MRSFVAAPGESDHAKFVALDGDFLVGVCGNIHDSLMVIDEAHDQEALVKEVGDHGRGFRVAVGALGPPCIVSCLQRAQGVVKVRLGLDDGVCVNLD